MKHETSIQDSFFRADPNLGLCNVSRKTVNHCSEGRQPPAGGIDNILRMDCQKSQNLKSQNRLSKSLK